MEIDKQIIVQTNTTEKNEKNQLPWVLTAIRRFLKFFYYAIVLFGAIVMLIGFATLNKSPVFGLIIVIIGLLITLNPEKVLARKILAEADSANTKLKLTQAFLGLGFILLWTIFTTGTEFLKGGMDFAFAVKLLVLVVAVVNVVINWYKNSKF